MLLSSFQDHLQHSNLLPKNAKLVVAVSGGVDSVSLLHMLVQMKSFYNWQIVIAHVNHNQRSTSHKDTELVSHLSESYNIPFYLHKLPKRTSSEANLRKLRYEFLNNLNQELNFNYIVVAHHSDDKLETAIFNAIRGADRKGITAMQASRDNIVRPLLPFTKAEIITYANVNNLPYNQDETNENLNFSRNYVRHQLLPLGSKLYRDFSHNFHKQLNSLDELNQKIDSQLELILAGNAKVTETSIILSKESLLYLPVDIKRELLVYAIKKLDSTTALSKSNVAQALKFVENNKTGSQMHLKNNLHLAISYDTVKITCRPETTSTPSTKTVLLSKTKPFTNNNFSLRVVDNYDKVDGIRLKPQQLYVRNWSPGDRIKPLGLGGSKKLQDIFVDKKIPVNQRKTWPVVVNQNGEIVWLPQLAVAQAHFQKDETEDAITLVCEMK